MSKGFQWNKISYTDGDWYYFYAYYNGEELGYLEYYKKWKKYVWNQNEDIIMSKSCLQEVINKINKLENGDLDD